MSFFRISLHSFGREGKGKKRGEIVQHTPAGTRKEKEKRSGETTYLPLRDCPAWERKKKSQRWASEQV